MRKTALVVSTGLFAACGATSVAVARAEPAFPDFDNFTAVSPAAYDHTSGPRARNEPYLEFVTPDGLRCRFNTAAGVHDETTNQDLDCEGPIPGLTPEPQANCGDYSGVGSRGGLVYSFRRICDHSATGTLLPAGSKISAGNITCVVGSGSLTACQDSRLGQRHGFVLQSSGSAAF
jgi:hypothetical protein